MIDEIASGLRNALERGYSIESAVGSFINAGYNPQEVKEAARMITDGATTLLASSPEISSSSKSPAPLPSQSPQPSQSSSTQNQTSSVQQTPQKVNQEQKTQQPTFPIQQQQTQPLPTADKKKSHKTIIIGLVISLLILIGAAITFVVLYSDKILQLLKLK